MSAVPDVPWEESLRRFPKFHWLVWKEDAPINKRFNDKFSTYVCPSNATTLCKTKFSERRRMKNITKKKKREHSTHHKQHQTKKIKYIKVSEFCYETHPQTGHIRWIGERRTKTVSLSRFLGQKRKRNEVSENAPPSKKQRVDHHGTVPKPQTNDDQSIHPISDPHPSIHQSESNSNNFDHSIPRPRPNAPPIFDDIEAELCTDVIEVIEHGQHDGDNCDEDDDSKMVHNEDAMMNKSIQFVTELLMQCDFMEACVNEQSKILQYTQLYRGSMELMDAESFENTQRIESDYKSFLWMIGKYLASKNLEIIRAWSQTICFGRLKRHLMKIIRRGQLNDQRVFFKEDIKQMKQRRFLKTQRNESEKTSLEQNLASFDNLFETAKREYDSDETSGDEGEYDSDDSVFDPPSDNDQPEDELDEEDDDDGAEQEGQNAEQKEDEGESSSEEYDESEDEDASEDDSDEEEEDEPPFALPSESRIATNTQHKRALLTMRHILLKYKYCRKYAYFLFKKQRPRSTWKQSINEGKWVALHFPTMIAQIIDLDTTNATQVTECVARGLDDLEMIYNQFKANNAEQPTQIFCVASSLDIRNQCARWKRWIIGYLWSHKGKSLRLAFAEQYLIEEDYKAYMDTLSMIEERSKQALSGFIEDFIIVWEIFQSQVWSSSAYCEPLGNLAKGYMKPNVAAANVSKNMCIKAHCDDSKRLHEKMGYGIANYLVNKGVGVLKKKEMNHKRQKHRISKVIKRQQKGKQTKYTTP
eukprot:140361_1